ncbi:hypothetical protein FOCC_FOCC007153 [Frankliniella occidentalis]|nr:hypothetical protein FOCC_FOCC007153 [Frankliniella occidentalis]
MDEPVDEVLKSLVDSGKAVRLTVAEWASPGFADPKKDDKCIWFVQELEFLRFTISALGRTPSSSLFDDIQKAEPPKYFKQLRSF